MLPKHAVLVLFTQSDVDETGEQELGADDQTADVPDDKSGVIYSDSQSDVDETGDQSDITVDYSQETMAELPIGQNEQTGESETMMSDLVLPLKKRKYECVEKQHEIQKELFVKLECLDYQKWCHDRQSQDT